MTGRIKGLSLFTCSGASSRRARTCSRSRNTGLLNGLETNESPVTHSSPVNRRPYMEKLRPKTKRLGNISFTSVSCLSTCSQLASEKNSVLQRDRQLGSMLYSESVIPVCEEKDTRVWNHRAHIRFRINGACISPARLPGHR